MRRVLTFTVLFTGLVAVLAIAPGGAQGQIFVTNTPGPRPLVFVTNTPAPPSTTPSITPSMTSSATATDTSTPTPSITPTPTLTPTPTPIPLGPFEYPEGINSLTGLPFPDDEARDRRTLIVKISNYPPIVRPQTGLNLADVVYEVEAEGGVTRFAAIFRSNAPARVGSVRSARLLDLELIVMHNALLAYSGTSEPIQNIVRSLDYYYLFFTPLWGDNCEEAGFCRDQSLLDDGFPLEHTLFLDTSVLYEAATRRNVNTGYPARGFAFTEEPGAGGEPGVQLAIDWYGQGNALWQYDQSSGRYVRFTDGLPHMDAGDGEQLWVDNLVVIEVPHEERPDLFPEGASYASMDIVLRSTEEGQPGQGRAYVMRDGVWFQGFWRRQNNNPGSALQLIYGNNAPITLRPGRSWVSVVRFVGDAVIAETLDDTSATATAVSLTATPTIDPAAVDTD
jgi:hypothetical protein